IIVSQDNGGHFGQTPLYALTTLARRTASSLSSSLIIGSLRRYPSIAMSANTNMPAGKTLIISASPSRENSDNGLSAAYWNRASNSPLSQAPKPRPSFNPKISDANASAVERRPVSHSE